MNALKNLFSKRESKIQSYQDFWTWFQNNEKTFYNVVKKHSHIERDFFDKISPKLNELREGYFYLTGMLDENTVELVLTADGNIKNFAFVEELVKAAPVLNRWKFTAHKQALDIKDVTIELNGLTFGEQNLSFYSNDDLMYPDEIDLTIVHHDFNDEATRDDVTNGTYIFLDNFLGELNFATAIDSLAVIGKQDAVKELIPVSKLKDYLNWRAKEFLEKYDGVKRNTENSNYAIMEAELQNGNPLVATINTDLLQWDRKASHPWILTVEIKYGTAEENNGLPHKDIYDVLSKIEDEFGNSLKDFEGYLNIGRQTADGVREIYFACKDFRQPSKISDRILREYKSHFDIGYNIYKDKYWKSFERFSNV
jgi:hypothetical protein